MIDIPREADHQDLSSRAAAGLQIVQQAVQAAGAPEAVKAREQRRAERERKAYENHYLGTPQQPR